MDLLLDYIEYISCKNVFRYRQIQVSPLKNYGKTGWEYLIPPSAIYMCQWAGPALVQVMACHFFGVKPLPEPTLFYCQLDP